MTDTTPATEVALITGASGGLAREVSRTLAGNGWRLALVSRDLEHVPPTPGACLIEADVSTAPGAFRALELCKRETGQAPRALVNCAGSVLMSALHRTRSDQFRECMAANLDSSFYALQAFISSCLTDKKPGAAILISSVTARIGVSNHEAISAAKAAIEGLTRSAAATYSRNQIRVNAVAPGLMRSPATERLFSSANAERQLDAQYPLGRHGELADVARAVCWLLSAQASWITGQVIPVDGGFTAVRPLQRAV